MKISQILATVLALAILCPAAHGAPPIYKEKEYFGPIPFNSFTLNFGFFDGGDVDNLTEFLENYAVQHHGSEVFDELSNSPYVRLGYERQLTPNHFVRLTAGFTYLKFSSLGDLVLTLPSADTIANFDLGIERKFTAYLVTVEAGFLYHFVQPQVRTPSPYVGAGFGMLVPIVRLETDAFQGGEPFDRADGNFSKTSVQPAAHIELGVKFHVNEKYAVVGEGRYELGQSTLRVYNGNVNLNFAGFMLTVGLCYFL